MAEYKLQIPLSDEEVRSLKLDDIVYLTGNVITLCYSWHFRKVLEFLYNKKQPPMKLMGGVIYHCPGGFRKKGNRYEIKFVGSTTSSKFNLYTPDLIRLGSIKAVIGKGGMDLQTLRAMSEFGAVYLATVGGCSALYSCKVDKVVRVYWPQSHWANNVWELRVYNFGPLMVTMDSFGNSIYEEIMENAKRKFNNMFPQ